MKSLSASSRDQEIIQLIKRVIIKMRKELKGRRVILFGSRAQGTAQERSDFDIGIVGSKPLPYEVFFKIQDQLEDLPTLFTIQLVDFSRAGELFKKEALQSALTLLKL